MKNSDVTQKVLEILDSYCVDPVMEIRNMGEALMKIADALKGKSVAEARAIIDAVQSLESVRRQ